MAKLIGYSFIEIGTGTEVKWSTTLPFTVEYAAGRVYVDQVGLEVPDSAAPTHRVVERWQIDDITDLSPPEDYRQVGYGTPTYNGTLDRIEVNGTYVAIPQSEKDEDVRQGSIKDDPFTLELVNNLGTKSAADIVAYVEATVTDLASAKTLLKKMALVLALLVTTSGRGIPRSPGENE